VMCLFPDYLALKLMLNVIKDQVWLWYVCSVNFIIKVDNAGPCLLIYSHGQQVTFLSHGV